MTAFPQLINMAELTRFYGLIIKMFFRQSEHNPPHFHVEYGEYFAMIDINTLEMIEGDLPKRAMEMVKEWGALHKNDLEEIWKTQKFIKLPPLD